MKYLFISILFLLMGISCQEQLSQPTEQEVKNALTNWNDMKFPISEAPFTPGFPSEIKHINVIKISRKKGSRKLFISKIIVEGMPNQNVIPRREFSDTIDLELKKIEKIWVIENMKHRFKYLGNYNPADTHF